MPDIKIVTVEEPLAEVLEYVKSEQFRAELKKRVFGLVTVRITHSREDSFNAWIGVTGEGADVSLHAATAAGGGTTLRFWFGLKMVFAVGCLFLPLFGLGLLIGAVSYLKKASRAKSLAPRVESVLAMRFRLMKPGEHAGPQPTDLPAVP